MAEMSMLDIEQITVGDVLEWTGTDGFYWDYGGHYFVKEVLGYDNYLIDSKQGETTASHYGFRRLGVPIASPEAPSMIKSQMSALQAKNLEVGDYVQWIYGNGTLWDAGYHYKVLALNGPNNFTVETKTGSHQTDRDGFAFVPRPIDGKPPASLLDDILTIL